MQPRACSQVGLAVEPVTVSREEDSSRVQALRANDAWDRDGVETSGAPGEAW
jgi:hypothetical protein